MKELRRGDWTVVWLFAARRGATGPFLGCLRAARAKKQGGEGKEMWGSGQVGELMCWAWRMTAGEGFQEVGLGLCRLHNNYSCSAFRFCLNWRGRSVRFERRGVVGLRIARVARHGVHELGEEETVTGSSGWRRESGAAAVGGRDASAREGRGSRRSEEGYRLLAWRRT